MNPPVENAPRRSEKRKLIVALLVLAISLGAIFWQVRDHQTRLAQLDPSIPVIEWRPASDAERKAVTAAIKSQLEAFKRDDYQAASKFQSSGLRRNFASAQSFRLMIKQTYPQFARYKTVDFGPMRAAKDGKYASVPVNVTGSDGTKVTAVYNMILEDNLWRVMGVAGGLSPTRKPAKPAITA